MPTALPVAFIHRLGSSLNQHVHLHVCAVDGVFNVVTGEEQSKPNNCNCKWTSRKPAGFQRQDGIGRRLLGKGRRVRSVMPAWRGQRTATNQTGAARHGRHGAHCRPARPLLSSGKPTFADAVFRAPVTSHWPRPRPCLNVADRPLCRAMHNGQQQPQRGASKQSLIDGCRPAP